MLREGTAKNRKQAVAICNSMYDDWKKKNKNTAEYYESMDMHPVFFMGSSLSLTDDAIATKEINGVKYDIVNVVAAVGDIFYSGVFISSEVLRKRAKNWNKTYNDINHFGTSYPAFPHYWGTQNIDYITGFNNKAKFDETIKAVTLKMFISQNSPKYNSWRSFVDISIAAKKIPNVSMFGFAKYTLIDAKDLQKKGIRVPKEAVSHDGKVLALEDITPFALTTCLKGKCDDKSGCGITASEEFEEEPIKIGNCTSGKCNLNSNKDQDSNSDKSEIEKKLKAHEDYLKKRNLIS